MNKCTFQHGQTRKEVINMDAGNRTLCIASLNPDTFINPEQRITITNMLLMQKIHIAAIQETHIPHDLNYTLNGYRIITSAAIKQIPEQTNPKQDCI